MDVTRRLIGSGLAAGAVAVVAMAGTTAAGAEATACPTAPPTQPEGMKVYSYSSKPQYFQVPQGANRLRVVATGAHGGQDNDTAPGGSGGGVEAYITAAPGECYVIKVGQFTVGSGGEGFSKGGRHGVTDGDGAGHTAGAGGGSTGITLGTTPLAVAGGGGGGGGDSLQSYGGAGGSGGLKAAGGQSGRGIPGGDGGCAACEASPNGGDGQSAGSDFDGGSGGGGGGGYPHGGEGGRRPTADYGGGGGGAGENFVHVDPKVRRIQDWTNGTNCPLRKVLSTCHGSLQLVWSKSATGTIEAPEPVVRVLSVDLDDFLDDGLPVSHSADEGPLELTLHLKRDQSQKPAVVETVQTAPDADTVQLEASARARHLVNDERFVQAKLISEHEDGDQKQRVVLR